MENQEQEVAAQPRKMIHLQVAGTHSQEELARLLTEFQKTWQDQGVIATPNNVVASLIQSSEELSGLILTPKMTAVEIAYVAVEAIRAFDIAQGNEPSASFPELEADAQQEVMKRLQCVMRLGALPPTDGDTAEATRDAIFVATVRTLGNNLTKPNVQNIISVIKVAQKEGDEDKEVKFHELVNGDVFKHGEGIFVAESDPYVNWTAHPLPVLTLDAKVYQVPGDVAPEDAKASASEEKKVQSKPSKSNSKKRK